MNLAFVVRSFIFEYNKIKKVLSYTNLIILTLIGKIHDNEYNKFNLVHVVQKGSIFQVTLPGHLFTHFDLHKCPWCLECDIYSRLCCVC